MNNDILVIINWYEENINNLDHALERLNEVFKNITKYFLKLKTFLLLLFLLITTSI